MVTSTEGEIYMTLPNLHKLTPKQIAEAFLNNGLLDMKFEEVKFKSVDWTDGTQRYIYNGTWIDDHELGSIHAVAMSTIIVEINALGYIVADCSSVPRYLSDFL